MLVQPRVAGKLRVHYLAGTLVMYKGSSINLIHGAGVILGFFKWGGTHIFSLSGGHSKFLEKIGLKRLTWVFLCRNFKFLN